MVKPVTSIQKTFTGENHVLSYYGVDAWGKIIKIPNFQPVDVDNNPRLDVENEKTKRKMRLK